MPDTPAKPFVVPTPRASDFRASGALPDFPDRERRRRPRVLLEMPVRMRWLGPFGLETEITHTRNASRDGLLVTSANVRQIGTRLWTTFPYDPAVAFTESETPGRVSRCGAAVTGESLIAVEFDHRGQHSQDDALAPQIPAGRITRGDRRGHPRIALAFLVRVARDERIMGASRPYPETPPWPEETMTVDVSPRGMLFCTLRIYEAGERLVVTAPAGRDRSDGHRRARVVRIANVLADSPLSHVAVEFLS
jgi:hypothetical protein